jgi:hypothetical protein
MQTSQALQAPEFPWLDQHQFSKEELLACSRGELFGKGF